MTTQTTEHEHEWQYVQKQAVYEGFRITDLAFEGDEDDPGRTLFVAVASTADAEWQDVAEVIDHKISCTRCDIEYPYPEGGWEVDWH